MDFNSVFEGIKQTQNAINEELNLLKQINEEQKKELKKAKRFNIVMLIISLVSFALTGVGIIVGVLY